MSDLEDAIRAHAGSIGTLSIVRTDRSFQGNFQSREDRHKGWRVHVDADPVKALLGALLPPVLKPMTPATSASAADEDMFG